jgi:predicted metal-dependent hydrolase
MRSSLYPADELRRRTHAWAVKLRVNPRVVRVQEMRRKWGSCTSKGTITLAADLADQDSKFQDFVIVHELLHLRYASHGRVFKATLSAYVPGWTQFDVAVGQPAVIVRPVRLAATAGRNHAT